uniref:Uncharacterized protein n=1 Tax=Opuntia streptacantha TaxID=393608 RepID=A0A7C9A9W4_OPUST
MHILTSLQQCNRGRTKMELSHCGPRPPRYLAGNNLARWVGSMQGTPEQRKGEEGLERVHIRDSKSQRGCTYLLGNRSAPAGGAGVLDYSNGLGAWLSWMLRCSVGTSHNSLRVST